MQNMNGGEISDSELYESCRKITVIDWCEVCDKWKGSRGLTKREFEKVTKHMLNKGYISEKNFNEWQNKGNIDEMNRDLLQLIEKDPANTLVGYIQGLSTLSEQSIYTSLKSALTELFLEYRDCRFQLNWGQSSKIKMTGSTLLEDMRLVCCECKEIMKQRVLLKCLHSRCRRCSKEQSGCTASTLASTCSGTESSMVTKERPPDDIEEPVQETHLISLVCPLCEEESGVEDYIENRFISKIIAARDLNVCGHCKHEETIYYCNDCCFYLCDGCRDTCDIKKHSTIRRDPKSDIEDEFKKCLVHKKPLSYFCKDCKAFSCSARWDRVCYANKHESTKVGISAKKVKETIKNSLEEIKGRRDSLAKVGLLMDQASVYCDCLLESMDVCMVEQEAFLMTQLTRLLSKTESLSSRPDNREQDSKAPREGELQLTWGTNWEKEIDLLKPRLTSIFKQLQARKAVSTGTSDASQVPTKSSPNKLSFSYKVSTQEDCQVTGDQLSRVFTKICERLTSPQISAIALKLEEMNELMVPERELIISKETPTASAYELLGMMLKKRHAVQEFHDILKVVGGGGEHMAALLCAKPGCLNPIHTKKN